jgi:thiol-disulfide isomerase/thioredoxin
MKAIALILSMAFLAGCSSNREPIKTAHKGQRLPDFDLLLVDSSTYFNTSSLNNDKPVVLFYFGPYCPYSRAEMQGIIDNMDKLRGVHFLIFTTYPFSQMKAFYKKYRLDAYPNITVGLDYKNFFPDYFKTSIVPFLAVYGKNMRLNEAFEGQTPATQLNAVINE